MLSKSPHSHSGAAQLAVILGLLALPLALPAPAEVPSMYVADLLGTGSEAVDMNDHGVAIGVRSIDMGCGNDCAPTLVEGVWTGVDFTPLPWLPQWENIYLEGISNSGWIVGTAYNQSDIRGIVWKPAGAGYEILEIPNLPDCDYSTALGIDDSNRVVGFCNRQFPPVFKAFVWTDAGGVVDLADFGFPVDTPISISSGGTVAYLYGWYQLDVPGVVHENTSPPAGFRGPGAYASINDAGDQVRLIGPTTGENINYPFRYYNTGEWQQIWPSGGIDQSPFGVGSITSDLDIALTISATGLVAPGPAEEAGQVTARLSPAYGDAYVMEAEAMNESGEILGEFMLGRSQRLMRFVAAEECTADCIRISTVRMRAQFVEDPANPGSCVGEAYTRATVRLQVTDENGSPLEGVVVTGRFMDDEWLDQEKRGVTDSRGMARVRYRGAPCTGAIAFLVTSAELGGRTLDRVNGSLQAWMIPTS